MVGLLSYVLPGSKSGGASISGPSSSNSGSHVTDAPDFARVEIGPAAVHLKREILRLYWAGVKRELPHILLTLRRWQVKSEYATTVLDDEVDPHIHGYDTFLDQVSHSSRKFSQRLWESEPQEGDAPPSYTDALENRAWDYYSEMRSNRIKQSIRDSLDSRNDNDVLRRRARMLLQSLQLLDMDKMIEYREPEKILTFWKRPAAPQLTSHSLDNEDFPIFTPQLCSECKSVIRGSVFTNINDETREICESCYREHHYGQSDYTKGYKQCCLKKTMTSQISRKMCKCASVRRRDENGRLAALWPLDEGRDGHLKGGMGKVNCGLLEVTDMVAEAKYAATRLKAERDTTIEAVRRSDEALLRATAQRERPTKIPNPNTSSVPEYGSTFGLTTTSEEEIPIYIRSVTDKYPYGNVHMALRIGPLVIENGVANTHGGVLITSRDPPQLQVLRDSPQDIEDSLLLTGKTSRTLYSQRRPRAPKRYKAMMKQVVGGAFANFFDPEVEVQILDAFISLSLPLADEGISTAEKTAMMERSTTRLMAMISGYISPRLEVYVDTIVNRLLDPSLDLRWNFQSNNCQTFCDNLVDRDFFGSFFAPHEASLEKKDATIPAPLYLMSFVCRPGAYIKEKTKSKFDVPNGLTEEYLLKFRYGRHDESDIIDTLAEYWYDWGAFEGPIYPYQDVFPWDCTEAYGRYPIKCSECNISKHVLAFPFDSWSIISLHLARGRELYPKNPVGERARATSASSSAESRFPTGHMTDLDWFCNRLTVLLGQHSLLTAAVAMAKCASFRESTLWLHMQEDERKDRLKLGGIHRAQPFSHHFEKGAYQQYFISEWASLNRPLRIEAYEELRDWRATRGDINSNDNDNSDDHGGCGGCGGFACGVQTVGCVAGCAPTGGDTCGVGCVTSCGGHGGGGCGAGDGGGGGGCGGCGGGCGGCGG